MPSDKCNLITAKAMSLIFSLFDIALEVPFGIPQYVHCIVMNLSVSSFVSYSSLLTAKSVDLALACDGFFRNCPYFSLWLL